MKGEDLLFLDQANKRLDDALRLEYARLGLPADPFRVASLYAPPARSWSPQRRRPRQRGLAFWWTITELCQQEFLPYVFADAEDERNQYTMVVHQVIGCA